MDVDTNFQVRVTEKHIRTGIAGDCHHCAVALALDDATSDKECMVIEIDWILRLRVWSRVIVAPPEVRRFVYAIDGLDRDDDDRPKLPEKLGGTDLAPFEFTLPPQDHPDWEEECNECEGLFDRGELDGEGFCEECRAEEPTEGREADVR